MKHSIGRIIVGLICGTVVLIMGCATCGGAPKDNLPQFFVYIDNSVPPKLIDEIIQGGEVWNEQLLCPVFLFSTTRTKENNVVIIWTSLEKPILGMAWGDFMVQLNSEYEDLTNDAWRKIVTHELGHTMGISHIEDEPTCTMNPNITMPYDSELCDEEIEIAQTLSIQWCF